MRVEEALHAGSSKNRFKHAVEPNTTLRRAEMWRMWASLCRATTKQGARTTAHEENDQTTEKRALRNRVKFPAQSVAVSTLTLAQGRQGSTESTGSQLLLSGAGLRYKGSTTNQYFV